MYALSLNKDKRILSVTFEEYKSENDILVDKLPPSDINDYKYINNEYIYDPLPKPIIQSNPEPTIKDRLIILEKQNKKLQTQNDELTLALADVYGGNV